MDKDQYKAPPRVKNATNPATAFPLQERSYNFPGMTLRDYFAGQALIGELSSQSDAGFYPDEASGKLAQRAYSIADAMLAARTGGPTDER